MAFSKSRQSQARVAPLAALAAMLATLTGCEDTSPQAVSPSPAAFERSCISMYSDASVTGYWLPDALGEVSVGELLALTETSDTLVRRVDGTFTMRFRLGSDDMGFRLRPVAGLRVKSRHCGPGLAVIEAFEGTPPDNPQAERATLSYMVDLAVRARPEGSRSPAPMFDASTVPERYQSYVRQQRPCAGRVVFTPEQEFEGRIFPGGHDMTFWPKGSDMNQADVVEADQQGWDELAQAVRSSSSGGQTGPSAIGGELVVTFRGWRTANPSRCGHMGGTEHAIFLGKVLRASRADLAP